MTLSDGRPVPVTPAAWASEMRRLLLVLGVQPGFADVGDLRKLLAFQPNTYLGQGWLQLAGAARDWLAAQERKLVTLQLSADLMGVLADQPALPADERGARIVGAE